MLLLKFVVNVPKLNFYLSEAGDLLNVFFCDFYFASSCEGPAEENSKNFCERPQCPVSTCVQDASFPSDDCMTVFCKERKRKSFHRPAFFHTNCRLHDCKKNKTKLNIIFTITNMSERKEEIRANFFLI